MKKAVALKFQAQKTVVEYGQTNHSSKLYSLTPPTLSFANAAAICSAEREIRHRRLAHMNGKDLANKYKHAVSVSKFESSNSNCQTCKLSKAHKFPFGGKCKMATSAEKVIHSDVVGPIEDLFPHWYRYFATFKDEHSQINFVVLIRNKSVLHAAFVSF